jgi:hypothetical protein
MNMPAPNAAMNSRLSNHLVMTHSPNAQSAKAWFKRFIQMSESSSKDQAFTKPILEIQRVQQLQLRQHNQRRLQLLLHQLQRMINRDVADDRPQFQHHALNHHLHEDQFHLELPLAKLLGRS